jgi:hypothetical protein
MQRPCILALATAAFGLAGLASTAMAEDLGGAGQWLARKHEESGRTFCYAISAPIQSSDAVDGRGPVGALVTNLEGGAARDQVSLALGYSPKAGTVIKATIDGKNYILRRIEGDRAWARDEAADRMIVAAMRRGNRMRVSGTTESGVTVEDVFSLAGLSKALRLAAGACGLQ